MILLEQLFSLDQSPRTSFQPSLTGMSWTVTAVIIQSHEKKRSVSIKSHFTRSRSLCPVVVQELWKFGPRLLSKMLLPPRAI